MAGIQLYNKDKAAIFPNTKATNVDMTNGNYTGQTAESCIIDLYAKYGQLSGLDEQKNQIEVTVAYTLSVEKTNGDWLVQANWGNDFQLPNSSKPYAWKRTQFKFEGDPSPKTFYEIIAADVAEKTQTIYYATNNTETPEIVYPLKDGKEDTNEIQKNNFIPEGWSKDPISISATQPNVYMATRIKKEGVWEKFSAVVQFGKWAYDSIIVLKYAVTEGLDSEAPELDEVNPTNPGEAWSETINIDSDFTGKIWQITATSVNGVLSLVNNRIWSGPNLISIIK